MPVLRLTPDDLLAMEPWQAVCLVNALDLYEEENRIAAGYSTFEALVRSNMSGGGRAYQRDAAELRRRKAILYGEFEDVDAEVIPPRRATPVPAEALKAGRVMHINEYRANNRKTKARQ